MFAVIIVVEEYACALLIVGTLYGVPCAECHLRHQAYLPPGLGFCMYGKAKQESDKKITFYDLEVLMLL